MFTLFFSILSAWTCFFIPSYHTFKILNAPVPDQDELKRVSMYWAVLGCFLSIEYVAEWIVSWLPFYFEFKTLFLVFLALPQTQGGALIYNLYLQPFFASHEKRIDDGIVSMQAGVLSFAKDKLSMLWELLWSVINKTPANGQPPSSTSAQPATAPPVSLQSVVGLFQSYAPAIVSALQPAAAKPAAPVSAQSSAPSTGYSTSVSSTVTTPKADISDVAPSFPEPQHS